MASLGSPSIIANAASETSPLLVPENGGVARGDGIDERLVGSPLSEQGDDDGPEPWTTADRIRYSLLALGILLIGIVTVAVVKNSADDRVCRCSSRAFMPHLM